MKIYLVTDGEEIFGIYRTKENAEEHLKRLKEKNPLWTFYLEETETND